MTVSPSTPFRLLCRFLLTLCLVGGWLAAEAQAQIYPHKLGLQGLLLDANGAPLSGNYNLTFRIYDAASGGTALWQGVHENVLVSDGLYGVPLGLNPNALPPDLFIGLPRHLEVSVNGEVLAPRIELRAVPLAYAARTLTDDALQAGSNVSITRQADGILRIDANGGGGGGGLSSVATDATLEGDGTSGNPLGLDANAVQAGANVTVTRNNDGTFVVSSTGGGGSGGLTTVASDATLVGNGTGANPLGLADGAVTGGKLADGALVAGSNVTVTRQGDGAFRIGAAGGGGGFSLPFAGTTSSGGAAFGVANTGSGDGINVSSGNNGIRVAQAGNHGLLVNQANDGVNIASASGAGVAVGTAGNDGFRVIAAGNDGVLVQSAGRYGLNVANAVRGVDVNTTSSDGMLVRNAGQHGLLVQNATSRGVQVDQANMGVLVGTTGSNGIQVNQAGIDGMQIQNAGRDGVRVSSAAGFGLNVGSAVRGVDVNTTSSDGVLVRNAGRNGLYIQNTASHGLQIDQTNSLGLLVGNAGTNGLQVNQAGNDGIQIQAAAGDGIHVVSAGAWAGNFGGNVVVNGTLSKSGGSFKIDHPLDPANKYLAHSFVESPDMMNVYNGNAVLNTVGEAVVTLPDYFETLNRDFRYQLTAIGAPGPNLYIAEKISGNQFRIAGGAPGMEVSWQVTGIRQDAWANEHRIVVEQDKKPEARGFYLHPKLYGQPEARNVLRMDTPDDF